MGILLLLMCTLSVAAQQKLKMSVASFEQDPFDTTPQNSLYEKIDGSGARYAIIKVNSDLQDDNLKDYSFNFGNLKSIVEEHDGELWVYVQKNAKMVSISRNGYMSINKYDLRTTIEAGKCYVMQLSVARPVLHTQMVQFVVTPADAGAVITVKNAKPGSQEEMFGTTDANGSAAKALELGTYTYKVITNDYHTSEGRFVLSDRTKTHQEQVSLRANFSEITLRVNTDADIYVNNELKGNRTWTGTLRAGSYLVECRQQSHQPSSQYITVTENNNQTVDLNPPTPITGTLALTSSPLGAKIVVDGKENGITPSNINDLLTGSHSVTVSMEGYQSESRTVMIQENQTTTLNIRLNRTSAPAPTNQPKTLERREEPRTPVISKTKDANTSNFSGYIQPAVQAGTLMGFGGNIGFYVSDFNVEAYATMGMGKETVPMYNTSSLATSEANISGMMFGGKIGYGIKAGSSVRVTPQVGVGVLNVSGDDVGSSAICATAGARIEIDLGKSFGISLTPEGQFAVSKKEVFKQLEEVSSKIKGWGTGANLRVGLYLKF